MDDIVVKGVWAGFIGALFGDTIIHKIAYVLFHTSTTSQYIAGLIFHKDHFSDLEFLIGLFVHLFAGALVGIVIAMALRYFGQKYAYIKGIGVGLSMWIVHIAVIPNIVTEIQPYMLRTPAECLVDLGAHLAFSILATTVLLRRFEDTKL